MAGTVLTGGAASAAAETGTSSPAPAADRIKKAVKLHMVETDDSLVDKFKLLKELGFDGVEPGSPNEYSRQEMLEAKEASGLEIPGVVDSVHWDQTLSDPDPKVREQGREGLETAIADAKAYGASTVLLVPAVVNENVSYDDAYRRSQREIRRVLPMARDYGVKIAIENVWNHFLMSPLETARYIDEFDSPWIGAFFDVGNVVNYGWPEQWVRILGDRILKLDIKEYSRSLRDEQGPYAGFNVKIGEGDCNWPEVRKALDEIGYWGWSTAEVSGGGRERLADIKRRMDDVLF